jgi:hypothetical protein
MVLPSSEIWHLPFAVALRPLCEDQEIMWGVFNAPLVVLESHQCHWVEPT